MRVFTLAREQILPGTPDEVFPFFADARNLEAITPPSLGFSITTPGEIEMREGALIEYRLRVRGVPVKWLTRIEVWEPGERFVDAQVRGPYALWHHTHSFSALPGGGTSMRDVVRYRLPLGAVGALLGGWFVRREVRRIFDFRAERVGVLLDR